MKRKRLWQKANTSYSPGTQIARLGSFILETNPDIAGTMFSVSMLPKQGFSKRSNIKPAAIEELRKLLVEGVTAWEAATGTYITQQVE